MMIQLIGPAWLARPYQTVTGQDHLGLGSVSSDQILPSLAPGINVLTTHPRYWSFYTFLLDEFWQRSLSRTHSELSRFMRQGEFAFSVAVHLCPRHGNLGNVNGSQKTRPMANERRATYFSGENYIKADLGGYGYYFRGVMEQVGLVSLARPPTLPVDAPTPRLGRRVAAAFRSPIRETEYYKTYFGHYDVEIPREVLEGFADAACLCRLGTTEAPDRKPLLEAFFRPTPETAEAVRARTATVRLFLDLAKQTNGRAIDEDEFRRVLYFGKALSASYTPPEELIETYTRWHYYQLREYYALALDAIWSFICDYGPERGGALRPIPTTDVLEGITDIDFQAVAEALECPELAVLSLEEPLPAFLDSVSAVADAADLARGLSHPLNEYRLAQLALEHESQEARVGAPVLTLCLLFLRFGALSSTDRPEWEICRMGGEERLSVDQFFSTVRSAIRHEGQSARDFFRQLIYTYTIVQHQLVAYRKLPEDTYRFWEEGGRMTFSARQNPISFQDSRFAAVSTMCHELGLCGDFRSEHHPLTQDGERLLAGDSIA